MKEAGDVAVGSAGGLVIVDLDRHGCWVSFEPEQALLLAELLVSASVDAVSKPEGGAVAPQERRRRPLDARRRTPGRRP